MICECEKVEVEIQGFSTQGRLSIGIKRYEEEVLWPVVGDDGIDGYSGRCCEARTEMDLEMTLPYLYESSKGSTRQACPP